MDQKQAPEQSTRWSVAVVGESGKVFTAPLTFPSRTGAEAYVTCLIASGARSAVAYNSEDDER